MLWLTLEWFPLSGKKERKLKTVWWPFRDVNNYAQMNLLVCAVTQDSAPAWRVFFNCIQTGNFSPKSWYVNCFFPWASGFTAHSMIASMVPVSWAYGGRGKMGYKSLSTMSSSFLDERWGSVWSILLRPSVWPSVVKALHVYYLLVILTTTL